ncbi:MAG: hypothetical protein K2K60_04575 [Clostridia bacterium]|nr:hypothetical protein [Clostridia bacterium]
MEFKTKVKLLIILLAVMAASLIAGCSIGETSIDEFLEKNGAKNQMVTYYANGGSFTGGISSIPVKEVHYRENVCITSDFGQEQVPITRDGYVFQGWYYAELEDGKPVFKDEENNIVKSSGTPVDFNKKIQKGESWYICAEWERDVYVSYVLACDVDLTVTDKDGNTYKNGDEISFKNFVTGSTTTTVNGTTAPLESNNSTFLQMYSDKECTTPIVGYGQISKPATGVKKVEVYAKYIAGKYTVVRDAGGVNSMFNLYSSSDMAFYFFNADGNNTIDCKNISFYPKEKKELFNCQIVGNGFTLENLKFNQDYISGGDSYSMFGTFGETASISNLTLKNVTVTMSLRTNNANSALYLVSLGMGDNTKLENLVIDGVEMEISCPNSTDKITNLNYNQSEGTYSSDNLMFGGFDGTDEQFLALNTGIKVKNYKLAVKVGGQTVIEKNNQEADNE